MNIMVNEIKVSVLINNYNYSKFIAECIESVLNQTYKNFELIIVDDGSHDKSQDIILAYQKKYPHIIKAILKDNGGQASAFNAGFESASGEVICFLDSDDFWYPSKLEEVVKSYLKNDADIIEHSLHYNGETCRTIFQAKNPTEDMKAKGVFKIFTPTSCMSYSKELLKKVFPIREEGLRICADTYLVYKSLYFAEKVSSIRNPLTFYRIHGNNGWTNNPNADKNNFRKILNWLNEDLINEGYIPIPYGDAFIEYWVEKLDVKPNAEYILYGTGKMGELLFEKLTRDGAIVKCFVETNPKHISKNNVPVYSLEQLKQNKNLMNEIIIASSFFKEIKNLLISNEIEYFLIRSVIDYDMYKTGDY